MRAFPREFRGLDPQECNNRLNQDKLAVNAWKKQFGYTTTARNRLYDLFLLVKRLHSVRLIVYLANVMVCSMAQ